MAALELFLKKIRDSKYTHVFADPDRNNTAAIRAYEKAGFKKVSKQGDTGKIWMLWDIAKPL